MSTKLDRIANQTGILGIKINGSSFLLETLSITDDQSGYDYICNVNPVKHDNGNGEFHISITNKELVKGLPIGSWILYEGKITYNWGESRVYFKMLDSDGEFTDYILATTGRGSNGEFRVLDLAHSIFPCARNLVSDFPSSIIYEKYTAFLNYFIDSRNVKQFLYTNDNEEMIRIFQDQTLLIYSNYIKLYEELMHALKPSIDIRSRRLLKSIQNQCAESILKLK